MNVNTHPNTHARTHLHIHTPLWLRHVIRTLSRHLCNNPQRKPHKARQNCILTHCRSKTIRDKARDQAQSKALKQNPIEKNTENTKRNKVSDETPPPKKARKQTSTPNKVDNNNIDINVYKPGQMNNIKAAFVAKYLDEGMTKEDALAKWTQHREWLIEGLSHSEKVKRRFIKSTTSPQQPVSKKRERKEEAWRKGAILVFICVLTNW